MNNVSLLGRVCNEIELNFIEKTGMAIVKFTLAVNRMKKDETDFIRCVAFGKTAEIIADYVKKGQQIGLVGRIQTGSYEKEDGSKVYTTDVIIDRFDFVGNSNKEENTEIKPIENNDDIPF